MNRIAMRDRSREDTDACCEPARPDHHFILETFVARGYGPHFTEIAAHFGVQPEHGKQLLHDLTKTGLPMWLYPGTDLITHPPLPVGRAREELVGVPRRDGRGAPAALRRDVDHEHAAAHGEAERALRVVGQRVPGRHSSSG